jgi:rhamnulokinase
LPVYAGPVEASALGNLVVQARALGWVADQAEARRLVERSFPLVEYRPRGDKDAWTQAARRLEELKTRL